MSLRNFDPIRCHRNRASSIPRNETLPSPFSTTFPCQLENFDGLHVSQTTTRHMPYSSDPQSSSYHHRFGSHTSILPHFSEAPPVSSSNSSALAHNDASLAPRNTSIQHEDTLGLIQALDKDKGLIQSYLSQSELSTIDGSQCRDEDPRVADLKIGVSSFFTKFRKALTRRSLAKEYDRWQLQTYQTSRIEQLVAHLEEESKERGEGKIMKYIEAQFGVKELRDDILWGIRTLVFERLLGESGSSAILCFQSSKFRRFKLTELPFLVKGLRETEWIWELVQKRSSWLDSCQKYYDDSVDSRRAKSSRLDEWSRKRPRLDSSSDESRRLPRLSPILDESSGSSAPILPTTLVQLSEGCLSSATKIQTPNRPLDLYSYENVTKTADTPALANQTQSYNLQTGGRLSQIV